MIVRRTLVALSFFVACGVAWAQKQTLTMDTASSQVHFNLSDPLHAVHGTFRVQNGSVFFDHKGGTMGGRIAVDAASGQSGNGARDKKMTEDELKANKFTTVTFDPQRYNGTLAPTGDSEIVVDGVFTLLGTPHEITVPMKVHMDGTHCKAVGSFTIPYVKWGLKDPSILMLRVGKDVAIDLVLVGEVSGS
jgi:polyisoprenoid-binding protein YceI